MNLTTIQANDRLTKSTLISTVYLLENLTILTESLRNSYQSLIINGMFSDPAEDTYNY